MVCFSEQFHSRRRLASQKQVKIYCKRQLHELKKISLPSQQRTSPFSSRLLPPNRKSCWQHNPAVPSAFSPWPEQPPALTPGAPVPLPFPAHLPAAHIQLPNRSQLPRPTPGRSRIPRTGSRGAFSCRFPARCDVAFPSDTQHKGSFPRTPGAPGPRTPPSLAPSRPVPGQLCRPGP